MQKLVFLVKMSGRNVDREKRDRERREHISTIEYTAVCSLANEVREYICNLLLL